MAESAPTPVEEKPEVPPVSFVHLHGHTEYSALDGACKVDKLPERLSELGMDMMAVTDHGNVQCWPAFEKAMKKAGKKPIFGCELYLTPDRHNKGRETPTYHLTVLAETNEGLKNLMKISTYAYTEGLTALFGRPRPRADFELLERYSSGLIVFSGCMASPTMSSIFRGDLAQARKEVERLVAIFGVENVYGEIQNVGITEQIPAFSELAYKLKRQGDNMPPEYSPEKRREWEQRLAVMTQRQIEEDPQAQKIQAVLEKTAPLSQNDANRELAEICGALGVELVATGDLHYLRESDAFNHDAMICLGTGQIPQRMQPRKFSLLPQRYHIRSEAEMTEALGEWPEALANTRKIAERCNASIEYDKELLPKFPLPEEYQTFTDEQRSELHAFLKAGAQALGLQGADEYELKERNIAAAIFLRDLALKGLFERLQVSSYDEVPKEYQERLQFELAVVHRMGFDDYFNIVWDLLRYAHEEKIPAGPGRGSAAGSLVAYCLEITQLDPLQYNLLFERFLNPDRISMPDMDLDFSQVHLERMREYAREKYNTLAGCDTAVAQIVTFSTFKAKGALKDSARVLAEPTEEGRQNSLKLGNRLSGFIPTRPPNITLKEVWEGGSEMKAAYHGDPAAAEAIKLAGWLEGMVKTYGQHAAAVIIADHPMEEDVPLQVAYVKDKGTVLTTQWEMGAAEAIGLLKMDFLGLRNLDIIDNTLEKVRHVRGVDLGNLKQLYTTLPLDDKPTYDLYARGETVGTFQFESSGMRQALTEVKPTEFNDLIALVALYRPGPMQNIPAYAARKHGKEQVHYPDPRVEEVLAETYAITVYQEQSMLISRLLAGFTPGEADELRKAIGKKLKDKMDALEPKFIEGCIKNGVAKKIAAELWDDNRRAADYSFNKSHAACYAFVAYCTGYLKAHYPEEYMASLLSSVMGDKDKPRLYLSEAKRMGIRVLPPDLNRSLRDFSVHERDDKPGEYEILFGLTALKGVGEGVVAEIRQERDRGGNFTSIYDLIRRMPQLNKGTLQSLIKGGALDSTGASRKAMHDVVEGALDAAKKAVRAKEKDFIKAVAVRIEAAGPLGGADLLLETAGKKVKLRKVAKIAVDACCIKSWAENRVLTSDELVQAAEEALKKDEMRLARAEAKKTIHDEGHATSIADEEGEVLDLKTLVEQAATKAVESSAEERLERATELAGAAASFIAEELQERADAEDLESVLADSADAALDEEEWDHIEKLNYEREVLGIYVTGHPLDQDSKKWARYVHKGLGELSDEDIARHKDDTRRVVGALVGLEKKKTKRGDIWYIATVEDLTGARDVTLFKSALEGKEELLEVGRVIGLEIKVEEDTFAQSRQAEADELASGGGEEGAEGSSAAEIPIKAVARYIFSWQPDQIPESEMRSEAEAAVALPHVADTLLQASPPEAIKEVAAELSPSEGLPEQSLAEVEEDIAALPLDDVPHAPEAGQPDEVPDELVPNAPVAPVEAPVEDADETAEVEATAEEAADETPSGAGVVAPTIAHPGGNGASPEGGQLPPFIRIKVEPENFNEDIRNRLKEVFDSSPGPVPVKIQIGDKTYGGVSVMPTPELRDAVRDILHPPAPVAETA